MTIEKRPTRRPFVEQGGVLSVEGRAIIEALIDEANSDVETVETTANAAQTVATTAQATADNAQHYADFTPSPLFQWLSDSSGTYPAGDPTQNITFDLRDKDGTSQSQRVVQGALTTSSGNIALTNVSNTGTLSNSINILNSGTRSPRCEITVTFADSSQCVHVVGFDAVDQGSTGAIPVSGGGK